MTTTQPTPATTPSWVRRSITPCVTASCSSCGEPYADTYTGHAHHFASLDELTASLAALAADYDPPHTPPWVVQGGELLCWSCRMKRTCATQGHLWTFVEPVHLPSLRVTAPGHWWCTRTCGATSTSDPAIAVTPLELEAGL